MVSTRKNETVVYAAKHLWENNKNAAFLGFSDLCLQTHLESIHTQIWCGNILKDMTELEKSKDVHTFCLSLHKANQWHWFSSTIHSMLAQRKMVEAYRNSMHLRPGFENTWVDICTGDSLQCDSCGMKYSGHRTAKVWSLQAFLSSALPWKDQFFLLHGTFTLWLHCWECQQSAMLGDETDTCAPRTEPRSPINSIYATKESLDVTFQLLPSWTRCRLVMEEGSS